MKIAKYIFLTILIVGFASLTSAQKIKIRRSVAGKIKLVSGSCEFIKGLNELNLEFYYEDMLVGNFITEAEYITKKKKEYNEKKPGRGDAWEESWISDRSKRFEPRFEEKMNHQFKKRKLNIKAGKGIEAEYTLILKTTFTEPGFHVAHVPDAKSKAYIDAEAIFVESANPNNVLAKIHLDGVYGKDSRNPPRYNFNVDTGHRIQEAYGQAGKELVYFIWDKYFR